MAETTFDISDILIGTMIENDKDIDRGRSGRMLSFALFTAATILLPIWILALISAKLFGFTELGTAIGILVGGGAYINAFPFFVVTVPGVQAFVTTNALTGELIGYGPGWHFTYPWERREESGNISLQILTLTFFLSIPTTTAPVTFEIAFQYKSFLRIITNFMGVDETTIEEGFRSLIKNFLTEKVSNMVAVDLVKNEERLETIGQELEGFVTRPRNKEAPSARLYLLYGILAVATKINTFSLPEDVQKTMAAITEAKHLFEVVASAHGMTPEEFKAALNDGKITTTEFNHMKEQAMAISGNAEYVVHSIRGFDLNDAIRVAGEIFGNKGGK